MKSLSRERLYRRLRRVRLLGASLALVCTVALPLSYRHAAEILIFDTVSIAIGDGCGAAGFRSTPPTPEDVSTKLSIRELGPFKLFRSYILWHEYAGAWRPFHLAPPYAGGRHHLVVPLWQPLVLFACLAGFAHGSLFGLRRGDPSACSSCGYNLSGVPPVGGSITCPECGARRRSPAASPQSHRAAEQETPRMSSAV